MEVLSHMHDDSQYATSPSFPFPNAASIFDSNQISDLLENFNAARGFDADELAVHSDSTNSAYDGIYSYAVVSEPSPVILDPSWTLPRRGGLQDNAAAQAAAIEAMQQDHRALSVPTDASSLHPSSGSSAHSSPQSHPRTPNMQAIMPMDGTAADLLPHLETLSASPMSAPAMTYEFNTLDGAVDSLVGPARNRFVSRSFPYNSPRVPMQPRMHYTVDDHLAPDPRFYGGRRRSVSLSYPPQLPVQMQEHRPQFARQGSHPLMPQYQSLLPGLPGFGASRETVVKERKVAAQKRRATMQNVIADARLPSSITRKPPVSAPLVSLQQALDALTAVESYMQYCIMGANPNGEPDLSFVTTAHCHLIKDLQCRFKAQAQEQGL